MYAQPHSWQDILFPRMYKYVTLHDNRNFIGMINEGPWDEEIIMNYNDGPNVTTKFIKDGRVWYKSQRRICDNRSRDQSDVGPQASENELPLDAGKGKETFSSRVSRKDAVLLIHFRLFTCRNVK